MHTFTKKVDIHDKEETARIDVIGIEPLKSVRLKKITVLEIDSHALGIALRDRESAHQPEPSTQISYTDNTIRYQLPIDKNTWENSADYYSYYLNRNSTNLDHAYTNQTIYFDNTTRVGQLRHAPLATVDLTLDLEFSHAIVRTSIIFLHKPGSFKDLNAHAILPDGVSINFYLVLKTDDVDDLFNEDSPTMITTTMIAKTHLLFGRFLKLFPNVEKTLLGEEKTPTVHVTSGIVNTFEVIPAI